MSSKKNHSRRVCIALITDKNENVLKGQRNDNGKWTNVGGHVEAGEDPYESMIRELKEETGLDAVDIKLVDCHWDKDQNILLYLFKVKVDQNQPIDTSKDPDQECLTWAYTNPNNVVEALHVPLERNLALKYWMNN